MLLSNQIFEPQQHKVEWVGDNGCASQLLGPTIKLILPADGQHSLKLKLFHLGNIMLNNNQKSPH